MAPTCASCGRSFQSDDAFDDHACVSSEEEDEGGLPFETPEEFADPNPYELPDDGAGDLETNNTLRVDDAGTVSSGTNTFET